MTMKRSKEELERLARDVIALNTPDKHSANSHCSDPTCSRCGGVHANDYDSYWEDGKGGLLCQMCWESVADEMWWDRMKEIGTIYSENSPVHTSEE